MIKYPNKTDTQTGENHRYAYYDSVMSAGGESNFELRTNYVDIEGEALYETFNQANTDSTLQIIAWNDEPATTTSSSSNEDASTATHSAHSKGVIIYDQSAENGIYLPHSTPQYPAVDDTGINITVGWSQRVYGQNYLCLSLDKENLEKVAEGMLLTGVTVYYNSITDKTATNLYKLGKGPSASSTADDFQTIPFSLGSMNIIGFFKNPYYDTGFIFENVMVPYLKDSLLVESWGRPYQAPTCDISGGYETDNIASIKLCNDDEGSWDNVNDHSKWAITKTKNYVCSGGMNRMTSQSKRGGAFFCFQDTAFWKVLNGIITSVDSCSSTASSFLQLVD